MHRAARRQGVRTRDRGLGGAEEPQVASRQLRSFARAMDSRAPPISRSCGEFRLLTLLQ